MNTESWEAIDPTTLGDLASVDPLIEYDGQPLSYIAVGPEGEVLYAHWLTGANGAEWYSISEITFDMLVALEADELDLRDAILRPKCWIAGWKRSGDGKLSNLYRVTPDQIPDDCLPDAGVKLRPEGCNP